MKAALEALYHRKKVIDLTNKDLIEHSKELSEGLSKVNKELADNSQELIEIDKAISILRRQD